MVEKADNLLNHRFRNSWQPHQWADLNNGTEDPDWSKGIDELPTSINRGTFITELTTAFALTGKTVYAKKALQLHSLVHQDQSVHPPPQVRGGP